jgi:hypothetical protein
MRLKRMRFSVFAIRSYNTCLKRNMILHVLKQFTVEIVSCAFMKAVSTKILSIPGT